MIRSGGVSVISERQDVALELLSVARNLAADQPVVSIADEKAAAHEQIQHGADAVLLIDHQDEADPGEVLLEALRSVHGRQAPDIVLIGATWRGTEIASRFAQREGVGCASECTRIEFQDGELIVERVCLGRFISRQVIETRPAIVTVQPRRFEPREPDRDRVGEIETLRIEAPPTRNPVVDSKHRERSSVRIDKAQVVVGIGRGLRSKDDLRMIEELARSLGGVVGASRPLTDDLEWLAPDLKIGLSGATIKPRLYLACGISGQIEHNVGMRESGVVVAINSDPDAPIMKQADYCITGDLHEVVPALIEAIREFGRNAG